MLQLRQSGCYEKLQSAVTNYHRVVLYDIKQLKQSIDNKMLQLESQLDRLNDELRRADKNRRSSIRNQIRYTQERITTLTALRRKYSMISQTYSQQANGLVSRVNDSSKAGVREMATYLRKIAGVENGGGRGVYSNVFSGNTNYTVVIIDSEKYPESAEHIRAAIKAGHPAMLTINRDGADENRKLSLAGIPIRDNFDRDEYPLPAFLKAEMERILPT